MTTNITDTVHIESPQHLSEVLHEASQQDQPVLPIGGGTCLSTGNRTDHGFLALDLTGLSGIDDYIPTDMTASFRAGTSLAEVRVALAATARSYRSILPRMMVARSEGFWWRPVSPVRDA
ncbi:MAG: FAD-dependent oxidoreductase [Thermomicrobiales bacterium]|nr:FAD-dependent oxidoreductase [Thermomicrobiales bacterium]